MRASKIETIIATARLYRHPFSGLLQHTLLVQRTDALGRIAEHARQHLVGVLAEQRLAGEIDPFAVEPVWRRRERRDADFGMIDLLPVATVAKLRIVLKQIARGLHHSGRNAGRL